MRLRDAREVHAYLEEAIARHQDVTLEAVARHHGALHARLRGPDRDERRRVWRIGVPGRRLRSMGEQERVFDNLRQHHPLLLTDLVEVCPIPHPEWQVLARRAFEDEAARWRSALAKLIGDIERVLASGGDYLAPIAPTVALPSAAFYSVNPERPVIPEAMVSVEWLTVEPAALLEPAPNPGRPPLERTDRLALLRRPYLAWPVDPDHRHRLLAPLDVARDGPGAFRLPEPSIEWRRIRLRVIP